MKKILILLLCVLLFVSVGLGIYGYLISNSSKYIFSKSIESTDKKLLKLTGDFVNTVIPNKKIQSGNYALNTTNNITYDKINLKTNMNIYMDEKNNKAFLNTKLLLNKNNIVLDALFQDKKLYFKIQDVFNNYYYINYDISLDIADNKKYEKKLIKYLEESINNNISDNNFKQKNETIKIGNKKYNTKKVTLVVREKLVDVIEINYLKKIKEDEELIKYIANINNTTTEKMKNKIDKEIEKTSKKTSNKNLFDYSIYVSNHKTLKHEIKIDKDLITVEDYIDNGKNILNVNYKEKTESILTGKFVYNKGNITINATSGDFKINAKAKIKNEYIDSTTEILNNNKPTGKLQYTFDKDNLILKGNMDGIKIDIQGKVKNEKIPSIDISKSKKYEEITEKEQQKLLEKILVVE